MIQTIFFHIFGKTNYEKKSGQKVMLTLDYFEFFQASLEIPMPYHYSFFLPLFYLKDAVILNFNLKKASIAQTLSLANY